MSEGQLWRQNYRDKAEMVGTRAEEGYVFFLSNILLKNCVYCTIYLGLSLKKINFKNTHLKYDTLVVTGLRSIL